MLFFYCVSDNLQNCHWLPKHASKLFLAVKNIFNLCKHFAVIIVNFHFGL